MKIAIFKRIAEKSAYEYETVGKPSYEEDPIFVRISEYVDVEFPPRAKDEVVQTQLAALETAEKAARTKFQEVLNSIEQRRDELKAITHQPESGT